MVEPAEFECIGIEGNARFPTVEVRARVIYVKMGKLISVDLDGLKRHIAEGVERYCKFAPPQSKPKP